MAPDMKFGWRPKVTAPKPPIPLYFDFLEHPYYEFGEDDTLVYHGFRPKTSFKLHEEFANKTDPPTYGFSFPSNYRIGSFKYEGVFEKLLKFCGNEETREFVGMNPKLDEPVYVFDSKFESGNLDLAVKLADRDNYYKLFLRPDTNSNGHIHWFYFSISGAKKGETATLNIANFTKYTSLFEQGFRPSVFSLEKFTSRKVGWQRGGKDIKYNKIIRRGRYFFTLEFNFEFEYDNDTVWFATSIPYTYSMM